MHTGFLHKSTRMHSSRMRTVRSSGRILGGIPGWGIPGPGGYLVRRGSVPGLRGRVYLVQGGVPGLGGYLVLGGVPGPGGCTWSVGVYLVPGGVPGARGCTWSWGGVPGPGAVYLVRYSPSVDRHTLVKT